MFKNLDPLLHSQARLAIMSILIGVKSAEFSYLMENIQTSKGNMSFQLSKLKEAGYIRIKKSFRKNYPLTTCYLTEKGLDAYEKYVESISGYFIKHNNKKNQ